VRYVVTRQSMAGDAPDFVETVIKNMDPEFRERTTQWLVQCILGRHPNAPQADKDTLTKSKFTRDQYIFLFLTCLCSVKEVQEHAMATCHPSRIMPFLRRLPTELNVMILGRHSWCRLVDKDHPLKYTGVDQFVRSMEADYLNRYDPHGAFAVFYSKG